MRNGEQIDVSTEPLTFAEFQNNLFRASNVALSAFAKVASDFAPIVAKVNAVFGLFGDMVVGTHTQIPSADYERLARRVAATYNCTHPARKLSRRRLNRPQRREVVRLWLEERKR